MSEHTTSWSEGATIARQILQEILQRMEFDATITVEETPEQITLALESDQPMGLLIGKNGQALNALELLVRTIAQTKLHSLEQHIVVDAEGYRARHAERLVEMVHQAAARLRETGEPVPLEPMNPRDRRTVHMAVAEMEGIASVSAGEEPYRHVVICLPGQCQDEAEA